MVQVGSGRCWLKVPSLWVKVAGIGSDQLMYGHFRTRWSYFCEQGLKTYSSKNYVNMSEIEELQLFSAVIFPASDPVVIIKETPTYDTGIPPTTRRLRVVSIV